MKKKFTRWPTGFILCAGFDYKSENGMSSIIELLTKVTQSSSLISKQTAKFVKVGTDFFLHFVSYQHLS